MPSHVLRNRFQSAVYWKSTGFDTHGEPTITSAVELCVRWEEVNTEVIDANGNSVGVDAVVVVDREIPDGSILWLGAIQDLPGTGETPTSNIYTVVKYSSIPDIKGRNYRRLVYLRRRNDELPAST